MGKKLLVIIIVLCMSLLTSCGQQSYVCPDGSVVDKSSDCFADNDSITTTQDTTQQTPKEKTSTALEERFELESRELSELISLKNTQFIKAPTPNQFGDESSVRHIPQTKSYETFFTTTMQFTPTEKYLAKNLFVKVIGADSNGNMNNVIYEGSLLSEETSITTSTIMLTQAESPRLKFCIGFSSDFDPFLEEDPHITCFARRIEAPAHKPFFNKKDILFDFDTSEARINETLTAQKSIILENDGTVPTTFFIYLPDVKEGFSLHTDTNTILMNPQEEKTITFTATWRYDGSTIVERYSGGIYTVGHSCAISEECFQGARVKESLLFEFQK